MESHHLNICRSLPVKWLCVVLFTGLFFDLSAQNPVEMIKQAESYSNAATSAIVNEDYENAYKLCSQILDIVQRGKDVYGCRYLPFYIDNAIFEPVIKHLARTDAGEAVRLCDGNLGLMEMKLSLWMEDGDIKTLQEYIRNMSFEYTKAAYMLQREGLNDAAEQYFSKAITIYEQSDVWSQEYCDALCDMADFQQFQKHDYAESIAFHAKLINAITRINGTESLAVQEAYKNMYDVYALATSWINFPDIMER